MLSGAHFRRGLSVNNVPTIAGTATTPLIHSLTAGSQSYSLMLTATGLMLIECHLEPGVLMYEELELAGISNHAWSRYRHNH